MSISLRYPASELFKLITLCCSTPTCCGRLAARSLRQRRLGALRVLLHICQLASRGCQAGGGFRKVLLSAIQHSNFGLKLAG